MHDTLAALANSWVFDALIFLLIAVIVVPMVGLALWYHGTIGSSEGGRRLMEKQRANAPIPRLNPKLGAGLEMGRAIEAGNYGPHAKRTQHTAYKVVALWLLAAGVVFALSMWLDAYRIVPGQ